MADGSSGNQGPIFLWQCKYCPKSFPGVPPDSFEFCPKCGKEQKQDPFVPKLSCIYPECKATLFSEKAAICHVCKKPQHHKPAATPTDPKAIEEHKLKVAQAVASRKQQSGQEAGADEPAGDQSAAEPQKGETHIPANHPHPSTVRQGATSENPIIIDSMSATISDTSMSIQVIKTDPAPKDVNESGSEGTTQLVKVEGNKLRDINVSIDGKKSNQPPNNTSTVSHTPDVPVVAAKETGTQSQSSGGPKQNLNSASDSKKSVPDQNSPKSTGSGVPDKDLARMRIDDVRMSTQNRKRNFEGNEGDRECSPKESGDSSTLTTGATAAKAPPTTTPPPNKKQKNNVSKHSEENTTTHLPANSNQSQVCLMPKYVHVILHTVRLLLATLCV